MNTNSNDWSVKSIVDNWFNNTFKTCFTSQSKDYKDYLEDTIWCNDRSMNTLTYIYYEYFNYDYVNSGWKPNGGSTSNYLYYSSHGRKNKWSSNLNMF